MKKLPLRRRKNRKTAATNGNGNYGLWSADCKKKREDRERNMKIYVCKHFCGFNNQLIGVLFDLSGERVGQILRGRGSDLPGAPAA